MGVVAFAAGDAPHAHDTPWSDALVRHGPHAVACAATAAGEIAIAADSEGVEVWAAGRHQRSLGSFVTTAVALAADHDRFAVGTSTGRIILGRVGEEPTGDVSLPRGEAVTALAFAADGQTLASGGHDGDLRLWEPATNSTRSPPTCVDERSGRPARP